MLRIFKNFRKQEVVLALFSVVFVVAQVWLELKLPDYMREITSLITTQDSAMHDILIAGGKMLLCAFGSLLVTVLVAVCASRIASNFSAIVRGKLFDKVQSFSMEEIGRFSRGDKARTSEGNGLGLAIVSTYAKALGGEFDIKIDCDQFKAIVSI